MGMECIFIIREDVLHHIQYLVNIVIYYFIYAILYKKIANQCIINI